LTLPDLSPRTDFVFGIKQNLLFEMIYQLLLLFSYKLTLIKLLNQILQIPFDIFRLPHKITLLFQILFHILHFCKKLSLFKFFYSNFFVKILLLHNSLSVHLLSIIFLILKREFVYWVLPHLNWFLVFYQICLIHFLWYSVPFGWFWSSFFALFVKMFSIT